jgi:hypothetical protein
MNALLTMIPPKARKVLYAVLAAALAVYAIWEAVDGDWTQFGIAVTTAMVQIMAAGNVDTTGNSVTVADAGVAHVVTPTTESHFQL